MIKKTNSFTAFNRIKTVDLSALSNEHQQAPVPDKRPPLGSFRNLGKSISEIQKIKEPPSTDNAIAKSVDPTFEYRSKQNTVDTNTSIDTTMSKYVEHTTEPSSKLDSANTYATTYNTMVKPVEHSTESSSNLVSVNTHTSTEATMVDSVDHTAEPSSKLDSLNTNTTINNTMVKPVEDSTELSCNLGGVNTHTSIVSTMVESVEHTAEPSSKLDSANTYTPTYNTMVNNVEHSAESINKPNSVNAHTSTETAMVESVDITSEYSSKPDTVNTTTNYTMVKPVGHITKPSSKLDTKSVYSSTEASAVNFLNSNYKIKFKSKYTKVPNSFFSFCNTLKPVEQIIYLILYRLSYGWGSSQTHIPLSPQYLSSYTGMSHVTVRNSLRNLENNNYIIKGPLIKSKGQHINIKWIDERRSEINDKQEFCCYDNEIFDSLLKTLTPSEFLIFFYLYRLSYGFHKNITIDKVGASKISQVLNLCNKTVVRSIKGLISKNLVVRLGNLSNDGFIYRVDLPLSFFKKEIVGTITYEPLPPTDTTMVDTTILPTTSSTMVNNKPILVNSLGILKTLNQGRISTDTTMVATIDSKNKENIKTSSGDVDEIFFFFNSEFQKIKANDFALSKKKIDKLLQVHTKDFLKDSFKKLIFTLTADSITNPVGIFLHALNNPESYQKLSEPSENEKQQQRQQEIMIAVKEKAFVEEQKKYFDDIIEKHWLQLDENKKQEFINERREKLGQGSGDLKIPEVVIKRSAMEHAFWQDSQSLWKSLSTQDQQRRLNEAKSNIIKRVYVQKNDDGNITIPDKLPQTDFAERVGEWAEKLAMISVGKGK